MDFKCQQYWHSRHLPVVAQQFWRNNCAFMATPAVQLAALFGLIVSLLVTWLTAPCMWEKQVARMPVIAAHLSRREIRREFRAARHAGLKSIASLRGGT
jgi:hypothetical protein